MVFPVLAGLLAGKGAAAAITAGGTIAGALINKSSQDKANKRNEELNDPVYARERLEAAGFNPGVKYGGYTAPHIEASTHGSIIASGMAAAADQLQVDAQQAIQITELEMQRDHLNAQLERSKLNPYVSGIYGNGQGNQNTGAHHNGSSGGVRPDDALGNATLPDVGDRTATNPGVAGGGGYVNPRRADAEMSEARYGDIAQEFSGGMNLISDNWYNDRLSEVRQEYGPKVANQVHKEYAKADGRSIHQIIREVSKGKPKRSVRPRAREDVGRLMPPSQNDYRPRPLSTFMDLK